MICAHPGSHKLCCSRNRCTGAFQLAGSGGRTVLRADFDLPAIYCRDLPGKLQVFNRFQCSRPATSYRICWCIPFSRWGARFLVLSSPPSSQSPTRSLPFCNLMLLPACFTFPLLLFCPPLFLNWNQEFWGEEGRYVMKQYCFL